MKLTVDFEFTDALREQMQQQGLALPLLTFQGMKIPPELTQMSPGDSVHMEGIPDTIPMRIAARSWTVSKEGCRLLLVLAGG